MSTIPIIVAQQSDETCWFHCVNLFGRIRLIHILDHYARHTSRNGINPRVFYPKHRRFVIVVLVDHYYACVITMMYFLLLRCVVSRVTTTVRIRTTTVIRARNRHIIISP